MIVLTEVAKKIENILNGKDTETTSLTNPADYDFVVYTEGFHLDRVYDQKSGKNFIPVFISSMGGQYNPVQGLKQANYTIPVVIYFPVRFKNDFFAINDFLADAFVGTNLTYGTLSGKAISNISVSQYGEIQELDLDQFRKWIEQKYRTAINMHEPWMSLQFTLYLSTADSEFIWGNEAATTITATIGETTYSAIPVYFDNGSIMSNSQVQSEQELGTNESKGIPFGTSYGASFHLYLKRTTDGFYMALLKAWFDGDIQELSFDLTITIESTSFTRKCFVSSVNMPILKGQLLSMTCTFAPKIED